MFDSTKEAGSDPATFALSNMPPHVLVIFLKIKTSQREFLISNLKSPRYTYDVRTRFFFHIL